MSEQWLLSVAATTGYEPHRPGSYRAGVVIVVSITWLFVCSIVKECEIAISTLVLVIESSIDGGSRRYCICCVGGWVLHKHHWC